MKDTEIEALVDEADRINRNYDLAACIHVYIRRSATAITAIQAENSILRTEKHADAEAIGALRAVIRSIAGGNDE